MCTSYYMCVCVCVCVYMYACSMYTCLYIIYVCIVSELSSACIVHVATHTYIMYIHVICT